MELNDILAGADTVMTAELVRLFKVAGCSPTACHACKKTIDAGHIFKLVSFNGTDEMCCKKHGEADLAKRDEKKNRKAYLSRQAGGGTVTNPGDVREINRRSADLRGEWAGYSRPSKTE